MGAAFAFVGMLLLSLVVAQMAALQLADFFRATEEFILVIGIMVVVPVVAIVVFAAAYGFARRVRTLNIIAIVLAVLFAIAPVALGLLAPLSARSTNPYSVGSDDIHILVELVVPAMITVLVQWGLVRRRWLRMRGEDDLTLWPWITTVIGSLVILNPYGLAFLQSALNHGAGGDFMWEFTATVTGCVVAALLVMVWVECYIRDRILKRRLNPAPLPAATLK